MSCCYREWGVVIGAPIGLGRIRGVAMGVRGGYRGSYRSRVGLRVFLWGCGVAIGDPIGIERD